MRKITLTEKDFKQLRRELPTISFDVSQDAEVELPLLQQHLQEYRFPAIQDKSVKFRAGAMDMDNWRIACFYWMPENPKGTTFVVHGYFDHTGLYNHLIKYLLDQGQAVVAFDLPGHGLSTGQRLSIGSFERYTQVLANVVSCCGAFPAPFNAVGQSTGGAILICYLHMLYQSSTANQFAEINLMAPLLKPAGWRWGRLLYQFLSPFAKVTSRKFKKNSNDRSFVRFIRSYEPLQCKYIPLRWVKAMKGWLENFDKLPSLQVPINIIQGERDNTVDWRYNLEHISDRFPNAAIHCIPEAMHHLVNEKKAIRQKIFSCLALVGNNGDEEGRDHE